MNSALIALVVAAVAYTALKRRLARGNPPPGPKGLPLIGNALQMPTAHEWLTFDKWAKQFGDIVHICVLGQPIVILSSPAVINEMFERRGAIYSDRPRLEMGGELMGYVDSPPLSPYAPRHREYRKVFFSALAPKHHPELQAVQAAKCDVFLTRLLATPADFREHVRWFIAAVVYQISHGYDVRAMDDPLVKLAEQANTDFSRATAPGAYLVDMLPILRHVPEWFPGAGFKRDARVWRATMERLRDEVYDKIKAQVKQGTAAPSLTAGLIEANPDATPEEDYTYRWATASFYSAGSDTTVSAIESFFLTMSLYPDVQRAAQAEIDAVLAADGAGRHVPGYADRARLPYVENLLKEVLRWNPVAPLALPHRLMQDDVYEGYTLKANSIVFANSWSILHNPALYPDPYVFRPERYEEQAGGLNPDPAQFAFGYGRRVCPGQMLADMSLFLSVAATLALFDIRKARGPDGRELEPSTKYQPGVISHPPEFGLTITPRSEEARKIVEGLAL